MIRGLRSVIFLFPFLCGFSSALELEDMATGVYRYSGSMTEQQRGLIWDLEDVALSKGEEGFRFIQSAVQLGDSGIWGVLSDRLNLGVIDIKSSEFIGSWPLARWEDEFIEKEVERSFYHGRQWPGTKDYFGDLSGCMAGNPMSYGDVNGDGIPEIIFFLPNEFTLDMIVFSERKGKVIFSSPIYTTNSIEIGKADQSLIDPNPERRYQYYLRSGQIIVGMGHAMAPGIRAYGKIYTGDFDEDGNLDLLLWRKLYRSLPVSSETPGFERLSQVRLHYAMVGGEYQQATTPESVVQDWLEENNLTWQKGFPSHSECPGEESELIPEMHDPLLNDPDVLQ